jgi:hypothetical protein
MNKNRFKKVNWICMAQDMYEKKVPECGHENLYLSIFGEYLD